MWDSPRHTYEEVRDVVMDILLKRENVSYEPSQWQSLVDGVQEVFSRRAAKSGQRLHPSDEELVRDVFWDLFRQGFITLGMNNSNPMWPHFRLSPFGQAALQTQAPYRFHNTASYLSMVRQEVPDISTEAVTYLDEAVAAFYAGCLLASCVMLGVAAEAEFLRLVDIAVSHPDHGRHFSGVQKEQVIRKKITKFKAALDHLATPLPRDVTEDLETNLLAIQSILRIARNEAGHPSAANPEREQVYVYLQLFIPFARQLMRLRGSLCDQSAAG
jgi:hypothetical protein